MANTLGLKLTGGLVLTVESGAHAGARLHNAQGQLSVGSALTNDAVLIADGLAAHHVRISLTDAWQSKAQLAAVDALVQLDVGTKLRPGQSQVVSLPATFVAGGATFRVETARLWQDVIPGGKRSLTAVAVLAIAFLGINALSGLSGLFASSVDGGQISRQVSPGPNAASVNEAQAAFRDRLDKAGLGNEIQVEAGPSGTLVALGNVGAANVEKWRDLLKWYDSRPSSPLLVNNVTRTAQAKDVPQLRSVWVDVNPQVMLSSGQTARVGDTIAGGWRIEAIDQQAVVLSRDGRTTRLTY
ncbi:hypothetical protein [Rhabdaerophilum sp. SD176]|uniref:SctD/MshK family protein n=1 Tax=Rhabdaerophilum sp. SD176 TaxID=2983548 RepID=UPI0024DFAFAF|nr:hypothetical protein [Rhabdaerophilum sp. SD176]